MEEYNRTVFERCQQLRKRTIYGTEVVRRTCGSGVQIRISILLGHIYTNNVL